MKMAPILLVVMLTICGTVASAATVTVKRVATLRVTPAGFSIQLLPEDATSGTVCTPVTTRSQDDGKGMLAVLLSAIALARPVTIEYNFANGACNLVAITMESPPGTP